MIDEFEINGIIVGEESKNIIIDRETIELAIEFMEKSNDESPVPLKTLVSKMDGYEWIPENACVFVGQDVELSEAAKETIQHVHYYMNGKNSFILLSDQVDYMTNVNPVEGKEIYLDKLIEIADEVTDEALSYHPDFSKYRMDDGMFAVELFNSIWCFCKPSEFNDSYDVDGSPSLGAALGMRQMILDTCEEGKVLGFVVNDLSDNHEEKFVNLTLNSWQTQMQVTAHAKGTALTSGASMASFKHEFDGNITPLQHMLRVLNSNRYKEVQT